MALSRRPSSKDLLAQANKARERIKAEEEEERRLRQAAEEAKAQEEEVERRHTELCNRVAGLREEKKVKESAIAASRATYSSTIKSLNDEAKVKQNAIQARLDELQKECLQIEASRRSKVQDAESRYNIDTGKYVADIGSLDGNILKAQAELEDYETLHLLSVDEALASSLEPIHDTEAADDSTAAISAHEDAQSDGPEEATPDETSDTACERQNPQQPSPSQSGEEDRADGSGRGANETESKHSTITQDSETPASPGRGSAAEESDDEDEDEDPVRGGPRRRGLCASSTSSTSRLVEDETPIHPLFPMVMSLDDQWHEVKCYLCGANRPRDDPEFFTAVSELLKHISFSHFRGLEKRPLERKETLLRGSQRIFGAEDVETLQSGQNLNTNPIEKTRGTASVGYTGGRRKSHPRTNVEEEEDEEDESNVELDTASRPVPESSAQHDHQSRARSRSSSDASGLFKNKEHAISSVRKAASSISKSSRHAPQDLAFGADLLTDDIVPQPLEDLADAPQETQQFSLSKLLESIPPGQSRKSAHETAAPQPSMTSDQHSGSAHIDASYRAPEVDETARVQEPIKGRMTTAVARQQRDSGDPVMASGGPLRIEETSATSEPAPANETIRPAPAVQSPNNQLSDILKSLQTGNPPSKNAERAQSCSSDQVTPGVFSGRSKAPSQESPDKQQLHTTRLPTPTHASSAKPSDEEHSQILESQAHNARARPSGDSIERSLNSLMGQFGAQSGPSIDAIPSSHKWTPSKVMVENDGPPNTHILHGNCPNTRYSDRAWYFIRCKVCHANSFMSNENELVYFHGLQGLQRHVSQIHGMRARWQNLESWCEERLIEHDDYMRVCHNGESPRSPESSYGGNGNGFRNGRHYMKRPSSRTSQVQSGHRMTFPGDPRLKGREGQSKLKLDTAVPGAQSAYSAVARLEGPTRDDGDRPPNAAREAREMVFSRPIKSNTMAATPSGRFDYASGVQMHTTPYVPRERSRSSPPPGELSRGLGGSRNTSKSPPRKKQKYGEKDTETGSISKRFCSPAEASHEKRDNSR